MGRGAEVHLSVVVSWVEIREVFLGVGGPGLAACIQLLVVVRERLFQWSLGAYLSRKLVCKYVPSKSIQTLWTHTERLHVPCCRRPFWVTWVHGCVLDVSPAMISYLLLSLFQTRLLWLKPTRS